MNGRLFSWIQACDANVELHTLHSLLFGATLCDFMWRKANLEFNVAPSGRFFECSTQSRAEVELNCRQLLVSLHISYSCAKHSQTWNFAQAAGRALDLTQLGFHVKSCLINSFYFFVTSCTFVVTSCYATFGSGEGAQEAIFNSIWFDMFCHPLASHLSRTSTFNFQQLASVRWRNHFYRAHPGPLGPLAMSDGCVTVGHCIEGLPISQLAPWLQWQWQLIMPLKL